MRRLPLLRALPLVLSLLAAGTAAAQPQRDARRANDRLVSEALGGLGVRADAQRLQGAVDEAFSALWPRERYATYRLTDTQARALAFTALAFAADGGGWDEPEPPTPPTGRCQNAAERAYDLALAVPPDRFQLFLTGEETERVRVDAAYIGREGTSCGCRALADEAITLGAMLRGIVQPRRSDIVAAIERLRSTAASCR